MRRRWMNLGLLAGMLLGACDSQEPDKTPVPVPCGFYTVECQAAVDACEEPDENCDGVREACLRYDCSTSPSVPSDSGCGDPDGDCVDDQVVCEARATGCWRRLDACAAELGADACCDLELECVALEQQCAALADASGGSAGAPDSLTD